MADGSAAALAELLLAAEAARSGQLLASALAGDPPLVLWTVCVAQREEGFRAVSLEDVAGWLALHALEVLQWDAGHDAQADAAWASRSESCAERVSIAVQVADLAAGLAAEEEPSAAESARLLGLLHRAGDWLATDGRAAVEDPSSCLPGWLIEPGGTLAATLARLAADVLSGEAALPDSVRIDLDTCRERGEQARRRWPRALGAARLTQVTPCR